MFPAKSPQIPSSSPRKRSPNKNGRDDSPLTAEAWGHAARSCRQGTIDELLNGDEVSDHEVARPP